MFAYNDAGKTPLTLLREPFNPTSPIAIYFSKILDFIMDIDANMPNIIGKSKCVPSFKISAGARFIVILCGGKISPKLESAALILSILSLTALSPRPTIVIPG